MDSGWTKSKPKEPGLYSIRRNGGTRVIEYKCLLVRTVTQAIDVMTDTGLISNLTSWLPDDWLWYRHPEAPPIPEELRG